MTKRQKRGWHGLLVVLSMILLLTACTSKAQKAVEKVELGQKYLTEQNYTEAVASFTEAIGLDPENIPAYMGRAQAYMALGEYEKALKDYQFVSSRTEKMPYTQALSYVGQAEVYENTDEPDRALSSYRLAKVLLTASDAGKSESVSEDDVKVRLIGVLYAHAMLSEKIRAYDNALEDYEELLELGEKVEARRDSVLEERDQLSDEENSLTDPGQEAPADADASTDTEVKVPEEQETTSDTPAESTAASDSAASSTSTTSEKAASSSAVSSDAASSKMPAESKEEQPAVQEPVTLKASERTEPYEQELGWGTFMEQLDANWTITYQIGGNTVKMYWTRMFKANGTPYLKIESTVVYTLSAPVQSAEVGSMGSYPYYLDGAVVLTVPAGTKITEKKSFVNTVLATIKGAVEYEEGISSGSETTFGAAKFSDNTSLVEMKGRYLDECGYPDEYSSLTVQSGTKYWMGYVELDDWGPDTGNIIFRAN